MPALATWTPEDGVLGALAPLGLAASQPTALVVDLDPDGPPYPGSSSLAALVESSPRRADLVPSRRGLAVLRNGGITFGDAREVVEALIAGWPAVAIRLPPAPEPPSTPAPVVPVRPLLPGPMFEADGRPAVYQRAGWRVSRPGPGPLLPKPTPLSWGALLRGQMPVRDRWIRTWDRVWRMPWK